MSENGTDRNLNSQTDLGTDIANLQKSGLIELIVDSMKKIAYEKQRYETLQSTLKSEAGWKTYLYSYVPCLMKKTRIASIVKIAEDDLYKKFDFVQILHFMEEFKKLKRLLLTPD